MCAPGAGLIITAGEHVLSNIRNSLAPIPGSMVSSVVVMCVGLTATWHMIAITVRPRVRMLSQVVARCSVSTASHTTMSPTVKRSTWRDMAIILVTTMATRSGVTIVDLTIICQISVNIINLDSLCLEMAKDAFIVGLTIILLRKSVCRKMTWSEIS